MQSDKCNPALHPSVCYCNANLVIYWKRLMPEWSALEKNPSLLMGLAPFWCKSRAQRVAPPSLSDPSSEGG